MEDIIGTFSQKMGIPPQVASMGMALVSKYFKKPHQIMH
jgi:hypothetical protein